MQRRGRRRLTLTNRLLTLAALIVVITTVLLLVTSSVGVYEMVSRQQATRLTAYRDVVVAEISGRLTGAYRVTRTTAEETVFSGDDLQALRRALSAAAVENAPYLEGMVVLGADGAVVGAWPTDIVTEGLPATLPSGDDTASVSPFVWEGGDVLGAGRLWAMVRIPVREGPPRLLLSRIRTDFIAETLTDIADSDDAMLIMVFDADGTPIYVGGDATRLTGAQLEFAQDDGVPTRGLMSVEATSSYRGHYAELVSPTGLGWRVGMAEPAEHALRQTWGALRPGAFGWAAALAVALTASLAVVSRVTQPVTELERRARALASGAQLEPEAIEQTDEVGRLLEAFNSIVRRMNRLSDIAELMARASDRSLVLEGVTSSITHMVGVTDVDVLLLGEDGWLDLVAAAGALDGLEGARVRLTDVPWIASSIATGEPTAVSGVEGDALLGLHAIDGPSSALATPLRAGADVIGVVVVVRPGMTAFTQGESETVRSFAAQASVALQNARLFEEERISRREAEALRGIAETAASPTPVSETLETLAEMTAEMTGFEACRVVVGDREVYGMPPLTIDDRAGDWIAAYDGVDRYEPVHAPAFVTLADGPRVSELLTSVGAVSAVLTPILREDRVVALLILLSADEEFRPGPRVAALASAAAASATLALKNARLYEEAKSRADNLETIFRISHAVGSSLQTRVVLNRVLDVVQKLLSADAVMLMTYDTQRKTIRVPMARGILHRDMLEAAFRPGEDVPGRVYETREPERFDRISRVHTPLLDAASGQGLESLLVVPLLARGRSIGVLAVFARAESAFSADEMDLLRTFASQAALAMDTAEMFSREHHIASVLKESIQPTRLPRVTGVRAAQVYLPAGAEADIGGDYYDLFPAPDGRIVAAIGDVCGKGVEAATKTSMIKYAVRGMVAAGAEPAGILADLNRMLAETGDASNIVTLWIGYIDLERGELAYANGGHPPGLLLRAESREVERLATTGALLGAVPDAEWVERTVRVADGDTLLLYTDGVTEARAGVRFFGEGRVRRSLRAGGSAEDITQRLFALVHRFAAGDLRDDAAALALVMYPSEAASRGVKGDLPSGKGTEGIPTDLEGSL